MATDIYETELNKIHITDIIFSSNADELNIYASNQCLPDTTHFEKEVKPIFTINNPEKNVYITGTYMYAYYITPKYRSLFGNEYYDFDTHLIGEFLKKFYIENIWISGEEDNVHNWHIRTYISFNRIHDVNYSNLYLY